MALFCTKHSFTSDTVCFMQMLTHMHTHTCCQGAPVSNFWWVVLWWAKYHDKHSAWFIKLLHAHCHDQIHVGHICMLLSYLIQNTLQWIWSAASQYIAAWLHCCWQLRNALGSKVQYRFSSLFECLENELMRYSHVCQAVVVSMTLVTVALYINVLNGYQCSDWTSMVFVSESSITSNCQSAAWHTDSSSTICSWVPCARIRTFWASAKGWEIPKPQHKDQNLSVGTKILISKQAMGKDRQADT